MESSLPMTDTEPLPSSLCRRILRHFGMAPQPSATLETLRLLVACYTRIVPWESASRIVRRARVADSQACFLAGADFWESHFATGSGGTCYESNYAFWGLLRRLGYEGYLTLNDMGEHVGCHSAIVIRLAGQKWLVDVGFPLYTCIAIDAEQETRADGGVDGVVELPVIRQVGSKYESQDEYVIVQVKGGNVSPDAVKALSETVRRLGAVAGIMVCFGSQMGTVENQRDKSLWSDAYNQYPYIQGFSIEQLIAGEKPNMPPTYGYRHGGKTSAPQFL